MAGYDEVNVISNDELAKLFCQVAGVSGYSPQTLLAQKGIVEEYRHNLSRDLKENGNFGTFRDTGASNRTITILRLILIKGIMLAKEIAYNKKISEWQKEERAKAAKKKVYEKMDTGQISGGFHVGGVSRRKIEREE